MGAEVCGLRVLVNALASARLMRLWMRLRSSPEYFIGPPNAIVQKSARGSGGQKRLDRCGRPGPRSRAAGLGARAHRSGAGSGAPEGPRGRSA